MQLWRGGVARGRKGRKVLPGYSEACTAGHHEACVDPQCRCLHHPTVRAMMQQSQTRPTVTATGTLVCPVCDHTPRIGDQFCRVDGNKLISGKVCRCGKAGEPDDVFCGGCGQKFGPVAVPIPELSEEEIAALEARARQRPSDVETPPIEVH